MLHRGPSPASVPATLPVTEATSLNESKPEKKNLPSLSVRFAIGPPAPAAPSRTPGSVSPVCAIARMELHASATTNTSTFARLLSRGECAGLTPFDQTLENVVRWRFIVVFSCRATAASRMDQRTRTNGPWGDRFFELGEPRVCNLNAATRSRAIRA